MSRMPTSQMACGHAIQHSNGDRGCRLCQPCVLYPHVPNPKTASALLRELRQSYGHSMGDVVRGYGHGLTVPSLSDLERGHRPEQPGELVSLCRWLATHTPQAVQP